MKLKFPMKAKINSQFIVNKLNFYKIIWIKFNVVTLYKKFINLRKKIFKRKI